MVVLPLSALALVGTKLVADQHALAQHEVERGFGERLKSLDQAIQTIVRSFERELGRYAAELPRGTDAEALREAIQRLPRALMVLVIGLDGRVVYPPLGHAVSQREQAFLERTRVVWEGGLLPVMTMQESGATGDERGWLSFFHGGSQHFLWWRIEGQRVVAIEVSSVELMTELVTQLPDTPVEGEGSDVAERTVLADPSGQTIYQWGQREPSPGEKPKAVLGLTEPLAAWSLKHYAPDSALPAAIAGTLRTGLIGGLAGLGLALAAGAWLIWRVRTRESRIAAQRVSFVNQVSHELKTPLTNIRMYAELLRDLREGDDTFEPSGAEGRYLDVIDRESERLSRLIKNVLTFARGQEDKLQVSRRPAVPDEVVEATLALHAPSIAQLGIEVEQDLAAKGRWRLDTDALEQILTNLVSNVEKYGKSGKWMRVSTRLEGRRFRLVVEDRGPGIPEHYREKIFEPFWRISDKLSDGVTGTGIGLDIARRLARLHGGDINAVAGAHGGARFEVELEVEPAVEE